MYHFLGRPGKMWEIKLNANCPKEEKSGSGPGSCGGGKSRHPEETFHALADEWGNIAGNESFNEINQLALKFKNLIDSNTLDAKYQKKAQQFLNVISKNIPNTDTNQLLISKPISKSVESTSKRPSTSVNKILSPDKIVSMLSKSAVPLDKNQISALRNYTIEDSDDPDFDVFKSYTSINEFIDSKKDWKNAPESMRDSKLLLTQALDKSIIPENIIVHRGIAGPVLGNNKIKLDNIKKSGYEYTEDRFVSTGVDKDKIKDFGSYTNTYLEIELPKGSRGRLLTGEESEHPEENEVLLPSGTRFKTTSISKDSEGNTIIHQKVIGQRISGRFKDFTEVSR